MDMDEESINTNGMQMIGASYMMRDKHLDDYYIWRAHHQLQTEDEVAFQKKFKSFRLPFRNEIRQDEKLDAYSHETYDQKKRIVPEPKMGALIERRYDQIAAEYFTKKYLKQKKAD